MNIKNNVYGLIQTIRGRTQANLTNLTEADKGLENLVHQELRIENNSITRFQ